jgi:hypothetical protein
MKAILKPEQHADLLIAQAVDTLMTTYAQTKRTGDGYGIIDRAKACRIITQRAVNLQKRGWPAKYNPVTSYDTSGFVSS